MEWLTKRKKSGKGIGDVYLSIVCKETKPQVGFSIKQSEVKKLTKTGYVKVALSKNRIYFDEAESHDGWKLNFMKSLNGHFKVALSSLNLEETVQGSYKLKFDEMFGYYYIDLTEKLERQELSFRGMR